MGGDVILNEAKTRNQWFTGIGIAGPAIMGGWMLLLYKIAMALIVGLGPFFILCLLFDLTKQMFHKWLWFGIGTLFSLAVLNAMVTLSLDAVLAVAGAFWVGEFIGSSSEGVTSVALQQGGLGLILSTLILGAPPMAALFFQGTMANFGAFNAFGNLAGAGGGGQQQMRPDGNGGMVPMNNYVNRGPAGNRPDGSSAPQSMQQQDLLNRSMTSSGQTQFESGVIARESKVRTPSPPPSY